MAAGLIGADPARPQSIGAERPFSPSPRVDERGFIDVWQLRRDAVEVEEREASDNADRCYLEGDPDKPETAAESEKRRLEEQACVENVRRTYAIYRAVFDSFNRAWLPVMREAIRRGDAVAEVILLQCDTTSAFDRSEIDSTCHPDFYAQARASKRLEEIGFAPAVERPFSHDNSRRAFTLYRPGVATGWHTDAFTKLRLNRKPQTPGRLTWGREAHAGGYRHPPDRPRERGRPGDIVAGELKIDEYLKQDPRWGVFLLHRVGHHEWVPEGMTSATQALDPAWEGVWGLEKQTKDWTTPMTPAKGRAVVKRNGELTQITIKTTVAADPFLDVADCTLRYSGGTTYLPQRPPFPTATLLGYFLPTGVRRPRNPTESEMLTGTFWGNQTNEEAVAPFDPSKHYPQVLMQCPNAETDGSDRLRFLLLAGDVLVEFGARVPYYPLSKYEPVVTLSVRHFRRLKADEAAQSPLLSDAATTEVSHAPAQVETKLVASANRALDIARDPSVQRAVLILLGILVAVAAAVYTVRRKKRIARSGDRK